MDPKIDPSSSKGEAAMIFDVILHTKRYGRRDLGTVPILQILNFESSKEIVSCSYPTRFSSS